MFSRFLRRYGVKLEVKGNISEAKGMGKFKEGQTLNNVLEVLSYPNNYKYRIKKDAV
ncbi:DUF4974 domain-containing protein [Algoriphagus machipongonensis]|uniref:DUF4974 domain-containing protein n=1 Tax=Algoriphagus machipongonensis TaxID=388413 RepID=UPI0012936C58|nr:DUF4974 domain-containing protein [Algoriphagus machipongonensis]